jgi:hypothetical protein
VATFGKMNSHLFFSIYVYIFLPSTLLYNRNTSRGLASADLMWKPFTRKRIQQQDSAEFFELLMESFCAHLANIFPLLDLAVTLECRSCNTEPSSLELCRTRRRSTTEAAQELHVGVRALLHREARQLLYHPAGERAEHPPCSYRPLYRTIRVSDTNERVPAAARTEALRGIVYRELTKLVNSHKRRSPR